MEYPLHSLNNNRSILIQVIRDVVLPSLASLIHLALTSEMVNQLIYHHEDGQVLSCHNLFQYHQIDAVFRNTRPAEYFISNHFTK